MDDTEEVTQARNGEPKSYGLEDCLLMLRGLGDAVAALGFIEDRGMLSPGALYALGNSVNLFAEMAQARWNDECKNRGAALEALPDDSPPSGRGERHSESPRPSSKGNRVGIGLAPREAKR